jgi:thiol:disulfide interchange protein DsbD
MGTKKPGQFKMFSRFLFCLTLILLLCSINVFAEDDFLPPEQAFAIQEPEVISSQADGNTLIISWKIADDYYIYRNKVSIQPDTVGLNLGEVKLSDSETKQDPFFGEIQIYKHHLRAEIPFTSDAGPGTVYNLTAKSQGCADAGICYPPLKQKLSFTLPAPINKALSAPPAVNAVDTLATLGNNTFSNNALSKKEPGTINFANEDDVLEIDEAFKFDLSTDQNNQLIAIWSIADGHYLYKDKFKFTLIDGNGFKLGTPAMPKGKQKSDEYLGDFEAYYQDLTIKIPVIDAGDNSRPLAVKVSYQGCSEAGICYPMAHKNVELDVSGFSTQMIAATTVNNETNASAATANQPAKAVQSEQDALANMLVSDNIFIALLTFFLIGLGLAFTPCVFPMIPILSGIIAGQGDKVTSRKAFTMSVVYVLSMAVVYTVVGIIAGLSGKNIQVIFQDPWVLTTFALIFVLLALSMFGFYNLQLPSSLQSRLSEISNKQEGGSLIGVSIMGVLSALIVGPCMAPPLMGILLFIGQTGDPVLGGTALFVMSLGMGVPLVILGTSAGKFMPKAGVWMDIVKAVFGVTMLAVAIWMMERVLPASIIMWLWALLLFISGIYMGALTPIHDNTSGWDRLWKGLGLMMMLYAAVLIIGVSSGNTDYFQPLKGHTTFSGNSSSAQHVTFKPIKSVADLDQQLSMAKQQNKPLMLDFYADWCTYCKSMEKTTFQSQKVITALEDFIVLQADVTANDELDEQLMKHLRVPAPPAILFYDPVSGENRGFRLVGYKNGDDFAEHVKKFLKN